MRVLEKSRILFYTTIVLLRILKGFNKHLHSVGTGLLHCLGNMTISIQYKSS